MSADPPAPRSTPKPYTNGETEPKSGVFEVHTGRTRRYVKWGAIIAAATTLLTPIANAVAIRIAGPVPTSTVCAKDAGQ